MSKWVLRSETVFYSDITDSHNGRITVNQNCDQSALGFWSLDSPISVRNVYLGILTKSCKFTQLLSSSISLLKLCLLVQPIAAPSFSNILWVPMLC